MVDPHSPASDPPKSKLREPWGRAHTIAVIAIIVAVTGIVLNNGKDTGGTTHNGDITHGDVTFIMGGPQPPLSEASTQPTAPTSSEGNLFHDGPCPSNTEAGWGPERALLPTDALNPVPTFNVDNTPGGIGDERGFYGIQDAASSDDRWHFTLGVEPGKEYRLRVYIHNGAGDGTIATNTRLTVTLPTCTGTRIGSNAMISSDNSSPAEVWAGVNMFSDKPFNVAYVDGSARYCTNHFVCHGADDGGIRLSNDFLTSAGSLLGYDQLDGRFKGQYRFSAFMTFLVRPQFAPGD